MRVRACVLGLALALAQVLGRTVLAEPLRISLGGLADPGSVSLAAPAADAARFVPAGRAAPASAADAAAVMEDEIGFVPVLALPRLEPEVGLALPRPDESQGLLRLLAGDGAVAVPQPVPEQRPLGAFGRREADGDRAVGELGGTADGPRAPDDDDEAAEDGFDPARDEAGAGGASTVPAPAPAPPLDRPEAPNHQRMLTVFIVVPLVLAAMLMLWRLDRRRGRRRRRGEGRHGARAHRR